MAEIPFWFHDRPKWVSGIGRQTTCQDVLHSLVRAQAAKKRAGNSNEETKKTSKSTESSDLEVEVKSICQNLVLVEQWRGVERPLSGTSRILKLWSAWGEERSQVKFIVKKVSGTTLLLQQPNIISSTNSLSRNRKKTRRRNSRLATDTRHPSALTRQGATSTSDIERLMRIILTQGETIHSQLKRLQEREGQIETIEEEVHNDRTKTAGKDYLLNAYLENLPDSDKDVPEMLEELSKIHRINEEITKVEERLADLHCVDDSTRVEITSLRSLNDKSGVEIDRNRRLISDMRTEFDQRRRLVSQLERDVGRVESEGRRLEFELRRVNSDRFLSTTPFDLFADEEEDLCLDDNLDFRLSSSQLYEDAPVLLLPSLPPSSTQDKLNVRTNGLTGQSSSSSHMENRISSTGSPGSSSSGCGTGSEREANTATPDLPPLPFKSSSSHYTKSILKNVDPSGDLDSNSDTGLSSLHSSSDEGTYVLDTLV